MYWLVAISNQQMIANHVHLCGGSRSGRASMVCVNKGCAVFALCCGSKDCDCSHGHMGHQMLTLDHILNMIAQHVPSLPDDVQKLQMNIDGLLDDLITSLQRLREKHHQHIKAHISRQIGSNSLLRKLRQHEPLRLKEGSGNCFYSIISSLGKSSQLSSPYSVNREQFQEQAMAVRGQVAAICQQIEQMWPASQETTQPLQQPSIEPQHYRFSATLKRKGIQLKQANHRATGEYLVLLEPSLPMSAVSTLTFHMNRKGNYIYVGVCYRSRAQQQNFLPAPNEAGHGLHMQSDEGNVWSDSVPSDNRQVLSDVRFSDGDDVRISLQPATGILTYSCNGKSFEQRTAITGSNEEPVHFCVYLSYNSDVSVVE